MTKITSELFGSYLKCRYKAHLKACGPAGQPSEYEHMREQLQQRYKERGFLHIFQAYKLHDMARPLIVTDRLLKEGLPVIVNARIVTVEMEAECDVLERVDEESPLGDFSYSPVFFRVAERISKDDPKENRRISKISPQP